jgi:hypothetical protein
MNQNVELVAVIQFAANGLYENSPVKLEWCILYSGRAVTMRSLDVADGSSNLILLVTLV